MPPSSAAHGSHAAHKAAAAKGGGSGVLWRAAVPHGRGAPRGGVGVHAASLVAPPVEARLGGSLSSRALESHTLITPRLCGEGPRAPPEIRRRARGPTGAREHRWRRRRASSRRAIVVNPWALCCSEMTFRTFGRRAPVGGRVATPVARSGLLAARRAVRGGAPLAGSHEGLRHTGETLCRLWAVTCWVHVAPC